MDIRTFRARSINDALQQVRQQLGDDAKVLHTRVKNGGFLASMIWGQQIEVAATVGAKPVEPVAIETDFDFRAQYRTQLAESADSQTELDDLFSTHSAAREPAGLPEQLFQLFAELIEADVDETVARRIVGVLSVSDSVGYTREILVDHLLGSVTTTGPITVGQKRPRVVALVGPTGVGKTTTIAKLAASFRLRENRRVGLITVDTFRVAAVEQLRTYADIIDLPMEVVATSTELRAAIHSMQHLDLILMDTAGRSPRDVVRIHELRHMLAAAEADDVLLVLSTTASDRSLTATCREFAPVGTTAVVLTKLDEAMSLGHLVGVLEEARLPVCYLTDGQNVPDDIAVAESETLVRRLLGYSPNVALA